MSQKPFYALLILMIGCGTAVSLGDLDPNISFDSTREIWSDVLRDVDEFGLHATRIPVEQEIELGSKIADQIRTWGAEDPAATKYVTAVGAQLVPHVNRHGMRYRFHVIRSPGINAFAVPGGQIYVQSGLLNFLQSEAELAAILGHEISHVDLRHSVERYQYELALKRGGLPEAGAVVEFAHSLAAIGYTQYQELEADASGERLAIEAGYDPDAAAAVFERMKIQSGEGAPAPATTPAGEVSQALGQALGDYFRTHPPSADRARQLTEMTSQNRRTLAGQLFYKGIRNYQERIPRSTQVFAAEQHIY